MLHKYPDLEPSEDQDDIPAVESENGRKPAEISRSGGFLMLSVLGAILTLGWISAVGFYVYARIGWPEAIDLPLQDMGALLLGTFAPLAFLWLLLGYFHQGREARLKGHALDQLMRELGYPSPEAEARVVSLTQTLQRHSRSLQGETDMAASRIGEATDRLETQETAAKAAAGGLIETSDRLKTELDTRATALVELIDRINEQGEQLNAAIRLQTSDLKAASTDAEQRSEAVQAALSSQITALNEAIRVADEKSRDIGYALEEAGQKISDTATDTLERTEKTRDALARQLTEMEEAAALLNSRLAEGTESLQTRGQEIIEISKKSTSEIAKTADMLLQSTTDLSMSSDEGVTRLNALRNTLLSSASDVEKALGALEGRESGLLETAQRAEGGVREATGRLAEDTESLALRTGQVTEQILAAGTKLRAETVQLDEILKATERSLAVIDDGMRDAQELLDAASEKSLRNADQLGQKLSGHAENLNAVSETAGERTTQIQEQLRSQITILEQASGEIMAMSEEISARLARDVDILAQAGDATNSQIAEVGSTLEKQAEGLRQTSDALTNRLREAGEELRREGSDIETSADKMSRSIASASEQLGKQHKELSASADQTKNRLASAIEEAIRHHQDFMATAERASLQARQSGEAAYSQTAELAKTAERAAAELRAMGDQATDHIEQLNKVASKAETQGARLADVTRSSLANINEASGSAKVHMDELADISVRAKEHAEAMEEILQQETQALSEIARQLTEQVEAVERTLSDRSALLDQSVQHASSAGEGFHQRTLELAKASELMIKGIKYADQALERHKIGIDEARQHIHADLDRVSEKIAEASRQVKEVGSEASNLFYGRAKNLIEFTTRANASARELGDQFETQQKRLTLSVKQVEETLNRSAGILKEESDSIRSSAERAAEEAVMSGLRIEQQTDNLTRAAEKARELADRVNQNRSKLHNERALKTTAFIMENLNSLTIDLSRIMDSNLSDDLWRRYRKGEKGIFTRKLLKTKDAEKIRLRYRENPDFRRFADQYVEEFRTIMSEASAAEHSELLSDAFITADVGKVYLLLQEALSGMD